MPAIWHSSAAGSGLCVQTVKITAASKRARAMRVDEAPLDVPASSRDPSASA